MDRRAWADRRDALLAAARERVLVMGVLNTTPDSFSDGGRHDAPEAALARASEMAGEGADVMDVGGESTRPGAEPVPDAKELRRVVPVLKALAERGGPPLSIDTYKASVARAAVSAGAVLINDVWGLTRDKDMAGAVAETAAGVVVTYNRGERNAEINLVDDMRAFFDAAFARLAAAGAPRERVWLDPGVGFAKTDAQNVEALRRIDALQDYGCPVLVGLSRKSFIGRALDRPVEARLAGTLGAHLAAVARGARIVRAHDVAEHRDALRLFDLIHGPAA